MAGNQYELRKAQHRFEDLLGRRSVEADFQQLFAEYPYILSNSLPLKLEPSDIRPLGRPGRSEPDFVVFPSQVGAIGSYGVIELKRPNTKILREPRKGVIQLSADARTALGQGLTYSREMATLHDSTLMLGNRTHIFAIMGLSDELAVKLGSELYQRQLAMDLPPGCQLIPYDTLFKAFSATVPPRLMVLVPSVDAVQLSHLLSFVEAARFDWRQFELTEESLGFWSLAEARLNSIASSDLRYFDELEFLVSHGSAESLGTEAEDRKELGTRVMSLIRRLCDIAKDNGFETQLYAFVRGFDAMFPGLSTSSPKPSPYAMEFLREEVKICKAQSRSVVFVQKGNKAVEELEEMGIMKKSHQVSEGEFLYHMHPFAQYLR